MRLTRWNKKAVALVALAPLLNACGLGELDIGQGAQAAGLAEDEGFPLVNTGPLPDDCAKIEGDQLGLDGLQVSFAGITVTVDNWVSKDDEAGSYIGFDYDATGAIWISVKSGLDIHAEAGDGSWHNPNGSAGPTVHAISNVVFCADEDDDVDKDGDDGDDGDDSFDKGGDDGNNDGDDDGYNDGDDGDDGGDSGDDGDDGDGTYDKGGDDSGGQDDAGGDSDPGPGVDGYGDDGDSGDGDDPGADGYGGDEGGGDDQPQCSEEHPELCPPYDPFGEGDAGGGDAPQCSPEHPELCSPIFELPPISFGGGDEGAGPCTEENLWECGG